MEQATSLDDLIMETPPIFSDSEISEMENLFREVGKDSVNQEFCQDLATSFSSSSSRIGKSPISWQQVQSWFQCKLEDPQDISGASISRKRPEMSIVLKGGTAEELAELAFEAKSSRDNAWYDVAAFLNYRFLCTGELATREKIKCLMYQSREKTEKNNYILEARVRFAGFGNSHDEWVNVRNGVRERSIPLEPSECHKVKVGDLVLCFQERPDYAMYVDAHVMEIQRRLHDIKGCRCIYVVRFDEDKTEEKVQLNKICCRPR